MILPEVWLSETEERVPRINRQMEIYRDELLKCHKDSMIFVERTQSDGSVRRGVILAVDLEAYDYTRGADSMIRATEATVLERIPPRVAIRRGACLELPHVMLLIDDAEQTVIEPLIARDDLTPAYDFDLMEGGGHIKGRFLSESAQKELTEALCSLATPEAMTARYGKAAIAPLLFAVGDGNHSLASAKAMYEEVKTALGEEAARNHPARYALVEVVNIHDDALKFEPIYRVMFDVNVEDFLASLSAYALTLKGDAEEQRVTFIDGEREGEIVFSTPAQQLTVGTLQTFIDEYLSTHKGATVDYIHGEDSVRALARKDGAVGFLFEGMQKSQLFPTVIFDGALPRKTFSMGHAVDKRYYLECRAIR